MEFNGYLKPVDNDLTNNEESSIYSNELNLETDLDSINDEENFCNNLLLHYSGRDEENSIRFFCNYQQKISTLESQLTKVNNENNILKNHLKSYIQALKLLQPEVQEFFQKNSDLDLDTSLISFPFYKEALEYEKKLIQVAEMHGELVEFNDRLQKIILYKEAVIEGLKAELVRLKGPLLELNSLEDDFSIISNRSISDKTDDFSVNLWIPTAFLSSQQNSSRSYHVYQIYIRIKDEEWNVYRRYSQFYSFYKWFKNNVTSKPVKSDFPPKKIFGNKHPSVIQDRRKKLELYLRNVVSIIQKEYNIVDKKGLILLLPFFRESRSKYVNDKFEELGTLTSEDPFSQCYIGY